MKLVVFSHKPCWPCASSPSGYATDGGFPFQMAALSELFDETRLLVPVKDQSRISGEIPLSGQQITIVPLTSRFGRGFTSKLSFIPWLLRNATTMIRELRAADAIHAPVPGDVGTVGMLLAWVYRKPLFVRHCGNWLKPKTVAEKIWRWFMETSAGGRNVMLATGGASSPPSQKNPNVCWIFSTSLTQAELDAYACPRSSPLREPRGSRREEAHSISCGSSQSLLKWAATTEGFNAADPVRLIIVARQEKAKGAGTVIQALPLLARRFAGVSFDIVGHGSAIPEFKRLAVECGLADRVHFPGKLNHEQVMQRLRDAHLFIFPTTSSDGFPKAVLEGLASGLPVVATRVSVLPQLLGNGCGVLLDEATPEAVARGIENVLSDESRYEAMSRMAIETARQYSLEAWRDQIGCHLTAAWGPLRGESRK